MKKIIYSSLPREEITNRIAAKTTATGNFIENLFGLIKFNNKKESEYDNLFKGNIKDKNNFLIRYISSRHPFTGFYNPMIRIKITSINSTKNEVEISAFLHWTDLTVASIILSLFTTICFLDHSMTGLLYVLAMILCMIIGGIYLQREKLNKEAINLVEYLIRNSSAAPL